MFARLSALGSFLAIASPPNRVCASGVRTESKRNLNFSCPQVEAVYHPNAKSLRIDEWSIVLNLSSQPIVYRTGGTGAVNVLGPFESKLVRRVRVSESQQLVVIRVVDPINIASIIFGSGWNLYADLDPRFPKTRTLWRSAKDTIGHIEIDPHVLTRQTPLDRNKYEVTLNLWYASGGTDCGIHQMHEFLELHTQISGSGRMQKFENANESSIYEDFIVATGLTHRTFATTDSDANFRYPWHRYFAESGCIWMAVELVEQ